MLVSMLFAFHAEPTTLSPPPHGASARPKPAAPVVVQAPKPALYTVGTRRGFPPFAYAPSTVMSPS